MNIKITCLHHPTKEIEVMLDENGFYEKGIKQCKKCKREGLSFYIDELGYKYISEREYEKQKDKREEISKLLLEDWKMTKDRIAHFNENLIRLRIQGIPIATAIQIGAFLISKDFSNKPICLPVIDISLSFINLIFFASAIYLIPIFLLDMFYFRMLLLSVKHAINIEKMKDFYGKLSITRSLTSKPLTTLHMAASIIMYIIIISVGIYLGITYGDYSIYPIIISKL